MTSRSPKIDLGEEILLRCECMDFEFVEVGWFNNEPKIFYITITCHPRTWVDRIKGAWRVLCGTKYGIVDGVLVNKKETKRLIRWLQKRTK